ncbi:MAG: prepilin-type N-terminal cleavage/methylation domain-containing protein [Syntrophaceae bacterium]|nr:prepilin-type N-terminal cleavage/methylation domain-containing protein [Syntrophaceae bacterium]
MNVFQKRELKGFTLIEIMISLVLVSLAIVSVIQLSSANLRNLAVAGDRIEILERANAKMREVLDSDHGEDASWKEINDDGYSYDISVTEILRDRSSALGVRLLDIEVSAKLRRQTGAGRVTLKTAKLVSRSADLKNDGKTAFHGSSVH